METNTEPQMGEETETEMDLSWLEKEEQYLDKNYHQTKCLIQIPIVFVYLDTKRTATHKETKNVLLEIPPEDTFSKMNKTELLEHIQQYGRSDTHTLEDIVCFHIPLKEENTQHFSQTVMEPAITQKYLKIYHSVASIKEDIVFEPTLRLLHEYSMIYVFYMETETPTTPSLPHKNVLKSILKSGALAPGKAMTKKVRIDCFYDKEGGNHLERNGGGHSGKKQSISVSNKKGRATRKIRILG